MVLTGVPTILCMSYQALLFCPDDKTAQVVTQVLTELDFAVEPSNEPFAAVKKLMAQHFDAIVVDCENEQNAALLFKSARNSNFNQQSLAVAVVEGQAGVAKAFRLGANLVLTKPINVEQSKGTLRVARGLLRKSDGKAPGEQTVRMKIPTPAPAAPTPAMTAPTPAPAKPVPPVQPKPSFTPPVAARPAPLPAVPVASATTFEVEEEPAPQPDATEAAFLDSIPEPVAPAASAPQKPAKQYPWQPAAKPAGAMASAMQKSSDVVESAPMPESAAPAAPKPGVSDSQKSRITDSQKARGLGLSRPTDSQKLRLSTPRLGMPLQNRPASAAASAPAPARQVERPAPPTLGLGASTGAAPEFESVTEAPRPEKKPAPAPTKLSITDPLAVEEVVPVQPPRLTIPETAPKSGGAKVGLIAAVVVLVIGAAGYFGWTKLHTGQNPASAPSAAATPATQQPPVNAAAQVTVVAPEHPGASSTSARASESEAKPSASKTTTRSVVAEPVEEPESRGPAAVVVRSGSIPHPSQEAQSAPVQAPDPIAAVPSSGDSAIAGIMGSSSVPLPKQGPQSLRVSQGVLQGLLIKKIQPTYPAQAIQMRMQGAVLLEAKIGKDGSILDARQVSGNTVLGRAAIDAVRKWKYRPYLLNGQPVEINTQITVNFQLP